MKISDKQLLKSGVLTALVALSAPASALEKPQTMEDMWKIIQAQQKQIDEMKSGMQSCCSCQDCRWRCKELRAKNRCSDQEVEKLRTNMSIPDEVKYKSAYGLGPAASKVYGAGKGLSIGGYGEANYPAKVGRKRQERQCRS